ncbi:MAG: hypothetical protein KJ066_19400 [Acidobacteria bacterium]|nr:hypothetical protein [Acidobacteriota bacterium]
MTRIEMHTLEAELFTVVSWRLRLGPGEVPTRQETAHAAIVFASALARLLSRLPPAVASEIRAHLVITEGTLRVLDDDVLESLAVMGPSRGVV